MPIAKAGKRQRNFDKLAPFQSVSENGCARCDALKYCKSVVMKTAFNSKKIYPLKCEAGQVYEPNREAETA